MASETNGAAAPTTDVEAGEATPLVPKIEEWPEDEPPPLQEMKEQSVKEQLVGVAGVVTFGTSLLAMLVEINPVVYISGLLGAAVAPYSIIQQQKITQTEALRQTNERMGEEVSQLKEENVRLQENVATLEDSVANLQEMSKTLETVRAVEGQSLDELEKQLEDSRKIFATIRENLAGDILQTIISVLLTIDEDGSGTLTDEEVEELMLRLEHLQNVDLKNDELREKFLSKGREITSVMEVASKLLDANTPKEESIAAYINRPEQRASLHVSTSIGV